MQINKYIKIIISIVIFCGIFVSIFPGKTVRVVLETIAFAVIGYYFLNIPSFFKRIEIKHKKILYVFFYYTILVFIHGCFRANSYEQWRLLITTFLPILLLPWFTFIGSIPVAFFVIIKQILFLAIPLSFIFLINGQLHGNENVFYIQYTSFVYVLILFLPYVNLKWKIYIIFLSIFSLVNNFDSRSNIISILYSYLCVVSLRIIKLNSLLFDPILKTLRIFFFIIPLILSILGYLDIVNIFQYIETREAESIEKTGGNTDINLAVDSRTSIYQDAIGSFNSVSKLIFGNSPVVYYKSTLSDIYSTTNDYDLGRLSGSEAAILNFFQWGGIIYVIIIFLLFYYSSYLAIYQSNNFLIKLIGIFISFRWLYLFIENPVSANFFWISMFLVFGVCLSARFRKMTNNEIESYFISI